MVTWCTFTGAAGPPPQPNDGSHAALAGAGVHVVAGAPVFMDTAFLFLHAMHDGGAVRVSSGTPSFIRVLFQSNVAGTDGGAVSMLGGRPAFTECRAASGVAGARGGAFYVAGAVPTLVGSLVSGNKAGDGGGGIFVTEPTAAVMQVTTVRCVYVCGGWGRGARQMAVVVLSSRSATWHDVACGMLKQHAPHTRSPSFRSCGPRSCSTLLLTGPRCWWLVMSP